VKNPKRKRQYVAVEAEHACNNRDHSSDPKKYNILAHEKEGETREKEAKERIEEARKGRLGREQ
jgi:hypothetical protein